MMFKEMEGSIWPKIRVGILGYGNIGRGVDYRFCKPGHGAYSCFQEEGQKT